MKPRRMSAAAIAVAVALMVSSASTVSASAAGFAPEPASSAGSHSDAHDSNSDAPSAGGDDASHGSSPGRTRTLAPDLCVGLARNTVLASCPAPCLPDAACIVYDQDPDFSTLTGCDYGTANSESICTIADEQTQTCELQCFARPQNDAVFGFAVNFKADELGDPQRRNRDASVLDTPMAGYPFQSNDFVRAIGPLHVSETVNEIFIAGMQDRGSPDRRVDVAVDRELLVSAPGIATLRLASIPLNDETLSGVLSHAPASLTTVVVARSNLTALPDVMFANVPQLEMLSLTGSAISFAYPTSLKLRNLKQLFLDSNGIEVFDAMTPRLEKLSLTDNKLLCIPSAIYSFRALQSLDLSKNRLLRPLVLTQDQVEFLEALPELALELVDPPYPEIVSALPPNDRGIESDAIDISQYLVDAVPGTLRNDPGLPILVASSENAQRYNRILESRASLFDGIPPSTLAPTEPPESTRPPNQLLPDSICIGMPRHTLLDNCVQGCPFNGACVVYDQDAQLSELTGCDYDVASAASFCTNVSSKAKICEFHCFPVFVPAPTDKTQFKFLVPFETELGERIKRNPYGFTGTGGSIVTLKTDEVPFLSNRFVDAVGPLTLHLPVSNVWISGGRTEVGTRGRVADVSVSSSLLSQVPAVTSLSLMNINFRESNVASVLVSAPPTLKSLNLRNTLLSQLPADVFDHVQELETLVLAQNELVDFSAQLSELKTLDLSENYLYSVNLNAPKLTTLDLSGNNFARMPPTVFALSALHSLNLVDNPLALPLVVSPSQLAFLRALDSLQLPTSSTPTTGAPSSKTNGTGTSVGTGGSATVVGADGSVIVVNGTVTVVGGVPVIVVKDETSLTKYNDALQQKQPSATPSPDARSMDGVASTSAKTSSNETMHGSMATGSSTSLPNASSGGNGTNSLNAITPPGQGTNTSGVDNTNASRASTSMSLASVLVLGGLGSAFFVVMVLLFVVYKRNRRGAKNVSDSDSYLVMGDSDTNNSSGSQVVAWWTDDDMLSHRLGSNDISDVRVIGGSGSSVVWLVNYRSGSQQLVSKRLIHGEGPAYEDKVLELIAEAKLASQLHHPSVVPFVGVAWTNRTDLQVLFAYMPNGSLSSYLARNDASTLPWMPDKLQLAIDIIEALVYTHSFNPPLLHRDLKSSNVLLDETLKAKLGDFGCARVESDSNTMTASEIGTGRWLAPEILLGSTSYGASSDIYSFGVVLCELDMHQVPYADEAQEVSEATLLQRVARGELRPSVSASCPPEIQQIADACLAFDATMRPNAMQVAYMLRSLMPRDSEDFTLS